MLGTAANGPGVMILAIEALFDAMNRAEADHTFALRLSYLEVYNESIRDLLAPEDGPPPPSGGLTLRQDAKNGITVGGLSEHEPTDAAAVLEMLERGNARRAVSETAANSVSSRSHAVLQISLRRATRASGVSDSYQLGKLTLVDLAGSVRPPLRRGGTSPHRPPRRLPAGVAYSDVRSALPLPPAHLPPLRARFRSARWPPPAAWACLPPSLLPHAGVDAPPPSVRGRTLSLRRAHLFLGVAGAWLGVSQPRRHSL